MTSQNHNCTWRQCKAWSRSNLSKPFIEMSQDLYCVIQPYPKKPIALVICVCNLNLRGHVISRFQRARFAYYPLYILLSPLEAPLGLFFALAFRRIRWLPSSKASCVGGKYLVQSKSRDEDEARTLTSGKDVGKGAWHAQV